MPGRLGHTIKIKSGQGLSVIYFQASVRSGPRPEPPPVLNAGSVSRMIEPYDWTTEAEEFSLHRSVVGHEDRGTVKDFRTGLDILDVLRKFGAAPEMLDG